MELIGYAERLVSATGARVRHGGNKAYYVPGADVIQVPLAKVCATCES